MVDSYVIFDPCQVQINDTIYLIGGTDQNPHSDDDFSRKVFTYSTINGSINVLPEMVEGHAYNSCTSFSNGSHTLIVTVGGENHDNIHNVTEIMAVGEHIWQLGMISEFKLIFLIFGILISRT